VQEEAARELQAALDAKEEELQAAKREAAAEADAAVVSRMQVSAGVAVSPSFCARGLSATWRSDGAGCSRDAGICLLNCFVAR
jgi:hypothetical protein